MSGGSNGNIIVNGDDASYDRDLCFDAPVEFDSGLFNDGRKTLATLRSDLMILLGFSAQAANPPAGMRNYLTLQLQLAQSQQYYRYAALRTERWWPWQLVAGRRFYDVPVDCTKALNFRRITGAWIADNGGQRVTAHAVSTAYALDTLVRPHADSDFLYRVTTPGTTAASAPAASAWPQALGATLVDGTVTFTAVDPPEARWSRLTQGIDPSRFGSNSRTMPDAFEVRERLEVWPIPDKTYVLYLKGHMGLKRFTQDNDLCTIDPEVILLFAAAVAKAHYRQPDANIYAQMAARMGHELTAGGHGLATYVPQPATGGMKPEYRGGATAPAVTWGRD